MLKRRIELVVLGIAVIQPEQRRTGVQLNILQICYRDGRSAEIPTLVQVKSGFKGQGEVAGHEQE